jgi:NADPH:quinone reductase-like Zn-dependent oxidoreductase
MSENRRVVIRAYGGVENLVVESGPPPSAPSDDEVELRVLHSCVSGADTNMRKNLYHIKFPPPFTPGYSVVGRVERRGANATRFATGDLVAALTVTGGQATRIVVNERFLSRVPNGCDPRAVVCLVLDYVTAYQMLHRKAQASAGRRIFVHGASGAVGRALAELAILERIEVLGTASPRNFSALEAAAVKPFDYANDAWVEKVRALGGVDAVFDPLGFESFSRSYAILRRRGMLIGYGFNLKQREGHRGNQVLSFMGLFARNALFWTGKRTTFYGISRDDPHFNQDLSKLLGFLAAGKISPAIKATFLLEDIRKAHTFWEKGEGIGSIVIDV